MTKRSKTISLMTDMALFAALGFVLDFLQGFICDFLPFWPNGGSVGVAMCATFLFSYRYGIWGLLCGLLTGLLTMLGGVYVSGLAVNPFQVFLQLGLDYFLAWTFVGLAGFFMPLIVKNTKHKYLWIVLGVVTGGFGKYLCHFLAGMIYWPTEDKMGNFLYSLLYNGSYMLPSILLCAVVMVLVSMKAPSLLKTKYQDTVLEKKTYFYMDFSFWTILASLAGFFYCLYLYCTSIEITFGEEFHADDNMLFFMILFFLIALLGFIQSLRKINGKKNSANLPE